LTAISKRLQKLEKILAPQTVEIHPWGSMVKVRNELLCVAAAKGQADAISIERELEDLGPHGLWLEMVRTFLAGHQIIQNGDESFTETIARALGIDSEDLRSFIARGSRELAIATDNEKDSIGSAPAEGWCGATEWSGRSASDRIH
jgi:hypothetical protein